MRNKLILALGLVSLVLAATAASAADHGKHRGNSVQVSLAPTPLATMNGLDLGDASGTARVQMQQGTVIIVVDLNGDELPEGSVLEGWVVDPGTEGGPGGSGVSSESDADEVYGTPFGDANIDDLVDRAAYALSTGVLKRLGNDTYQVIFRIENNLSPYNAVVVTLESDGNGDNYDPRPGTPVLAGLFNIP